MDNPNSGAGLIDIPKFTTALRGEIVTAQSWACMTSIQDVLDDANSLREKIKASASEHYAEARKAGKEKGYIEGRALVHEQLIKLNELRDSIRMEMESELAQLLIAVSNRLIGEVGYDPIIRRLTCEALNASKESTLLTLRVHPSVKDVAAAQVTDWMTQHPTVRHIEVIEDESIDPSECIVLSEVGEIRATLANELAALRSALTLQISKKEQLDSADLGQEVSTDNPLAQET